MADAPAPDAPPPPPMLASGTWMIASIARTPDPGMPCFATLFHIDVAADHVTVGDRRIECGSMTETISTLSFTAAGGMLSLGGQPVGTVSAQLLDVTLPGGAGSLKLDLTGATATYQESETALGTTTSFTGTLTLMPDDRPIALPISVAGTEDVSLTGRMRVARLPAANVTFTVSTAPPKGTATITDATTGDFTYLGHMNANGTDTIGFSVSDGTNPTTSAQVAVTLAPVEDAPVTTSQSLMVVEDTPTALPLTASDPDGDALTFTITTQPAHGTIAVAGTTVTYTPAQNYNGSDSFYYDVFDGQLYSSNTYVSLTVTPVNDPPVATPGQATTVGTNRAQITVAATDVDSSGLTYAIATQPAHGTLTGTAPSLIYKAVAGFTGDDTFTFTASDGMATSAPATFTVHVLAPTYSTTTLATYATGPQPVLSSPTAVYYVVVPTSILNPQVLYATDGTTTRTVVSQVANISTGKAFTVTGGDVIAYASPAGAEIHALSNGALLATATNPDPATYTQGVVIGRPSVAGATAYLLITWPGNSASIAEVWATDGTAAGTTRLYQLAPIATGRYLGLWELGGKQYLFADRDLVTFTGSTSAPTTVTTLTTGATAIYGITAAGRLFWEVDQKTGCTNGCDPARELYRSDGSAAGSSVIATVDSSFISYGAYYMTDYNNKLYFANAMDLYSADPVATGTTYIESFPTNGYNGTDISGMSVQMGKLFFSAYDEPYPNPRFWSVYVSDGTAAGTVKLATWAPGNTYVSGASITFDGLVWFPVTDATLGAVLWRTDLSIAGTQLELDMPVQTLLGTINGKLVVGTSTGVITVHRP